MRAASGDTARGGGVGGESGIQCHLFSSLSPLRPLVLEGRGEAAPARRGGAGVDKRGGTGGMMLEGDGEASDRGQVGW